MCCSSPGGEVVLVWVAPYYRKMDIVNNRLERLRQIELVAPYDPTAWHIHKVEHLVETVASSRLVVRSGRHVERRVKQRDDKNNKRPLIVAPMCQLTDKMKNGTGYGKQTLQFSALPTNRRTRASSPTPSGSTSYRSGKVKSWHGLSISLLPASSS
jgi:hypothetical protein